MFIELLAVTLIYYIFTTQNTNTGNYCKQFSTQPHVQGLNVYGSLFTCKFEQRNKKCCVMKISLSITW